MIVVTPTERDRGEDETTLRVIQLIAAGFGLGDVAAEVELEPVDVIDILHQHRDCFDRLACHWLA